jgi:ornithine cyclodeaminase/alanine dehydrogenase-like protein (mu-crystallin family)
MKIYDAATTRQALPFDALIRALEAMFIAGCETPLRHTHKIDVADAPAGTVLIMPAWQPGGLLGIKTVNIFAGNATHGLPGLYSTYVLYDATSGRPLAQIDGDEITSRRTAAASALAARYLARDDASRLLVVGSGRVARLLPEAFGAVRPLASVTVWSRHFDTAQALARQWCDAGIDAMATADLAAAASRADIVSCATLATEPVIRGEWLRPGTHLDLIGSFAPPMREADDACFTNCRLYIDTPEALQKSGELLGPMSRGVFAASDVAGTLEALCRGEVCGRRPGSERTVFKSVGTALEDLAAATLVHRSVA